ncbi:S9 family peptidase [Luteibacter aegosomatis]|uniref:alpha/beta hydrolase family protein n=1 Tax=Luteibacter aegosomatis TaxID=2911537 RepID=UPI001FF7FD26|nr:S9 family peptidase [Luteibacter aegosomatis]UPG84580.1 S9 family peptidase [Luteibacter aegosomatis]
MRAKLDAARAVAASADFTELAAAAGMLAYGRFDPADGATRLWLYRDGRATCLTPDGYSVRSRVNEYGGGTFCLAENAAFFVNESDQAIYRQELDGGAPVRFGGIDGGRYGDLVPDAVHGRLLAVEEHHADGAFPVHRLVAFDMSGARRVMAEGDDFYASPCVSRDGGTMAWIAWSRPHQPWTRTRLMRQIDGQPPRIVAHGDEAVQQPGFDARGRLLALTDRDGCWRPWRFADRVEPLPAPTADHAGAPWQMGTHTWVGLDDGRLLVTWFDQGFGRLSLLDGDTRTDLAPSYTRFRALAADGGTLYAIAASPTRPSTVLAIDAATGTVTVVAGGESPLPDECVTVPRAISWPVGEATARGFLYLPKGIERPPLVVFVHGGPTSATHPVFDARIQFWAGQGFAVADVNYRGSTGYGRAYRDALHEAWGVVDVDDACAVVPWLAAQGLVDPARAFIRGSSAGGYTVLCALAFRDVFRGGGSLYGVSDPLALGRATHKFEADYLDWLIGDPVADEARYRERTPLLHADGIDVPVIFFQGLRDAVVVPEQTESMVAALRARGVPCEYHAYPDERHGFRQAANLAHALEHEHAFYARLASAD